MSDTVHCLYKGLKRNPNALAAIEGERTLTYQQLATQSEALALALRDALPAGAPVALCAQNTLEHLQSFLAILLGGFIWIPINPKNGQPLNQHLLDSVNPALILTDSTSEKSLPDHNYTQWLLDDSQDNLTLRIKPYLNQSFTPASPNTNDVMGIKFTGGTTGTPKGVIQTHGNVNAVIDHLQTLYQFQQDDRNLAIAPLTHGGSHYILPILAAGACHLLMPTPDVNAITHALKVQQASISFMPPTLIYKLLDETNINAEDCPHLRHITYSAAPMPPERIQQFHQRLGPKLSTLYGQTEAPMTITAMAPEDLAQPHLTTSVGKACQQSEIAILDENHNPLPANTIGQIAVRGAIVTPAYFNAPHQTREAFHNGWLLTGDLGELNEEGYLFLKGRAKEMIISGGFNVYPAEVENIIAQHPAISECVVVGIADDYWGERVEAAICTHPDQTIDNEELLKEVKTKLGSVKTPKQLHHFATLPRNPVGKVVRRDILELILERA